MSVKSTSIRNLREAYHFIEAYILIYNNLQYLNLQKKFFFNILKQPSLRKKSKIFVIKMMSQITPPCIFLSLTRFLRHAYFFCTELPLPNCSFASLTTIPSYLIV